MKWRTLAKLEGSYQRQHKAAFDGRLTVASTAAEKSAVPTPRPDPAPIFFMSKHFLFKNVSFDQAQVTRSQSFYMFHLLLSWFNFVRQALPLSTWVQSHVSVVCQLGQNGRCCPILKFRIPA